MPNITPYQAAAQAFAATPTPKTAAAWILAMRRVHAGLSVSREEQEADIALMLRTITKTLCGIPLATPQADPGRVNAIAPKRLTEALAGVIAELVAQEAAQNARDAIAVTQEGDRLHVTIGEKAA